MSGGNDKHERELESFLADDSRVAALYRRLPKDEPDARLDAKILAQARAAVRPRRARSRWLPAMSAAAALVVVAGLAYRVGPQVWNERSGVFGESGTECRCARSGRCTAGQRRVGAARCTNIAIRRRARRSAGSSRGGDETRDAGRCAG